MMMGLEVGADTHTSLQHRRADCCSTLQRVTARVNDLLRHLQALVRECLTEFFLV
jgi:hypothetical protein